MDSQMVALLLAVMVGLAGASLRPSSPDELHELLVWAQRLAEGKEAHLPRLHDKHVPVEEASHRTPTPSPAEPAHHPVVPQSLLDERPPLPADEQYDSDHRYSHSILNGYRHGL